ncbi:hypothetical protein B0H10DRAFT_2442107 [Mycena sp. CBHHK59/15]|nr:hypothetical protein B0H10DRAFT_2442107 [Mycena sp. CBHHK59/15]
MVTMSYFPSISQSLGEPCVKPNCKCTSSLNSRPMPEFKPVVYGPFPNPHTEDWQDELPSRTWIHGDWYRDPSLSNPWSTDWEWWDGLRYYEETVDGKLKIEQMFKDDFHVPGTIEPVAYMTSYGDEFFLFTAAGRYYFWADGCLTVHRMQFGSPKEFLAHVLQGDDASCMPDMEIPMRRGADLEGP